MSLSIIPEKNRVMPMVTLLLALFFTGCTTGSTVPAGDTAAKTSTQSPAAATGQRRIATIGISEDDSQVAVLLTGEDKLLYTSVKQAFPLGVILYLPDTDLAVTERQIHPESDTINTVLASKIGPGGATARIEILLKRDLPYTVTEGGEGLTILFTKPAVHAETQPAAVPQPSEPPEVKSAVKAATAPAPATASATEAPEEHAETAVSEAVASIPAPSPQTPPATRIDGVVIRHDNGGIGVFITADGAMEKFKTFSIETPARVVFDFPGIHSAHKTEQKITAGDDRVRSVRYYNHPDYFRLVIDTLPEYLADFQAFPQTNGLAILLTGGSAPATGKPSSSAAGVPLAAASVVPAASAKRPSVTKNELAQVTRVDFSAGENGRSKVLIGTDRSVKYDLLRTGQQEFVLSLQDTRIAPYRQRPLVTTHFESALDEVLPVQTPAMGRHAEVLFKLREAVPYRIEQQENLITLHFDPSSIPPVPSGGTAPAASPVTLGSGAQAMADVVAPPSPKGSAMRLQATAQASAPPEQVGAAPASGTRFTGEKISLDFYETDIKNVFRILQSVSGKNFAIDKSVSGKVTMTLDTPVPWDQVLDLILRMNQLGMSTEGDIVRIATLESFRIEGEQRQAKLKAEQKAKETIKALAPLVTEYININYSNAATEILPHLEKVITPERGKLSADERNNQIIVTDTAEKMQQIKTVIQRIDRVTPQVMIEARIVEMNTDASEALGIEWAAELGEPIVDLVDPLGGNLKLDSAFDFGVASSSSMGFNFSRIGGTPFLLNARLTASETQGNAKIISSPKIITIDNKQAMIKQGFEIAYLERDDAGGSSVSFKNVDLLLEVTPHITPDKRISMSLNITKNDVFSVTAEGVPTLSTNQAQTELLVNDGETFVIGGIVKTTSTKSRKAFPGLSEIPYLGMLFQSNSESQDDNELLIFITPRIIQLEQRPVQ